MTLPRFAELVTAVIVIWYVTGGFLAALDAITATTRRGRLAAIGWSAGFGALAVAVVWVLAWTAATARGGG